MALRLSQKAETKKPWKTKKYFRKILNDRHCGLYPQSPDFDISLVPYFFYIKIIKENPDKTIKEVIQIHIEVGSIFGPKGSHLYNFRTVVMI